VADGRSITVSALLPLITEESSSERQHLPSEVVQIAVRNRDRTSGEEPRGLTRSGSVHLQKVLPGARAAWMGALAKFSFDALRSSLLTIGAAIQTTSLRPALASSQLTFRFTVHQNPRDPLVFLSAPTTNRLVSESNSERVSTAPVAVIIEA
jgi:hypothetical protein